jgi:iron complex outermembrane receptor protein
VTPFLRGVGNPAVTFGNESSTAIYIDGVYYSRLPPGFFSMSNIQRVEVLKGPQGTLFGRNSSGGVLQLITKDPSQDTSLMGSLSYGRFELLEGNLYATAGISNSIAADISISGRRQGKGYGRNLTTGNRANYMDDFTARTKWLFEASDTTRVTLAGYYSYSKVGAQGSTYPGTLRTYLSTPRTVAQATLPFYDANDDADANFETNGYGASLKLEQEVGFAKFSSITAYSHLRFKGLSDSDYGPRNDQVVQYGGPLRQFTQEFQLASLSGGPLQWVAGLFYYNTKTTFAPDSAFLSPSGAVTTVGFTNFSFFHAKSYAAFGQATLEVLPRLKLTGGLRYTWDRNNADGVLTRLNGTILSNPPGAKDKLNKLTFRAAADYQVTDRILTYASFSRGFKSAVFNILTYNPIPNRPEIIDAYEVGIKSDLFDKRVRLNAAVFYYDVKNPQVQLITNTTSLFSNADAARVKGAEFELQAILTPGLNGRAALTVLSSKYKQGGYGFVDANGICQRCAPTGTTPAGTQVLAPPFGAISPLRGIVAGGNYQPFSPKITFNTGFDYSIETGRGTVMLSADYFYNDGYFFEPDNFLKQSSFSIVNAQIKYSTSENFAVRIWGKNLLGEKYVTRAFTNAGAAGFPYTPGAPRIYGLGAEFKF